ncbi:hypothetical protein AQUCO_00200335v1 [Aquilegia coerulea]|uniref:Cation efflux protein transmembrane domain-containing protein n=1 Tax=Aquilegia coerulea TaxID=218851 RepID=A0A2G5F2R9_AQUCA|nr:hypothetical protein AQUCO_00200335v1 [Aquilegia coerulea]
MSDHQHHHHQQHRPHRLSVPPRVPNPTSISTTITSRSYPLYPYSSSTPTPTPSKQRLFSLPSINNRSNNNNNNTTNSFSSLFLLLFSLRSLYSLLPFLRSSPSFSLFPFSFLVSLLSFLLTFSFSLFSSSSPKDPFQKNYSKNGFFSLNSITQSQFYLLFAKSLVLAVVFLLRFQALRYCGTAATILAELSGNVAARFVTRSWNGNGNGGSGVYDWNYASKVRGFLALFCGLFLLSISWDRIECFPLSLLNVGRDEFLLFPGGKCLRVLPMLLPFLCGFLGCYERVSVNWGSIKQLGRKRVRMISLFFTTVVLFLPAFISFFLFEEEGIVVSIGNLGWPLANTVVFGVLLSENYSDDKFATSKDFKREFMVIFLFTVVLELFYFPEVSLCGLLFCGLLLWISVRELDPISSKYPELGFDSPDSLYSTIKKAFRHILSERKSRKIALFLFINTAYMVVEFVAGFMSNSLGLISDACHMLFDCAALAIGLYASYISRLPANSQFNYGRGRFEVLSGYVNAVLLVLVGALIVLESFERILDPQEISTNSLMTVSIGGLLVNVVGLIFFHEEHHHAHGGGGSCSHSHSHSHDHHHHSHDHDAHDHSSHNEHHECISISHGKSCGGHDHHSHDHAHHDHHEHNHNEKEGPRTQSDNISDQSQCHVDHQDHAHKHDCHDHGHQHDQHSHRHHIDNHTHQNHSSPASSLQTDPHGSHSHGEHSHSDSCNHKDHPRSSLENNDIKSKESLLERESVKEPQKKHRHIDHNMEGIFLHVLADTMGSVGVVISTLLIKYKGWLIADPVCSIFISVMIISSVISLLRNSAEILLQRVPRAHELELKQALDDILRIRGVHNIRNVHIWSFTNTDVVGTLHLHVSASSDKDSIKAQVSQLLLDSGINDLTVQTEYVKGT